MARTNTARASDSPPPAFRRWMRRLFVWGLVLSVLVVLALAVAVGLAAQSLPSFKQLKSSQVGQMIVVRARDGTELVSLGPSFGKWLPHEEIPQVMKDAMVSVEDRRYYSHIGVDPIGLARAGYMTATTGKSLRATSTITQQLARNVFLNNSRTVDRKLREGVLAMALEWKFSQGRDSGAVPEQGLFRRRRLRDRFRQPQVLQPPRDRAQPARSRDHRRAGQGPVALFANG